MAIGDGDQRLAKRMQMADDDEADYKDRIKISKRTMKKLCRDAAKCASRLNQYLEKSKKLEDVVENADCCALVARCETLRNKMEDMLDELQLTAPEMVERVCTLHSSFVCAWVYARKRTFNFWPTLTRALLAY
jgi:hypothetical protein